MADRATYGAVAVQGLGDWLRFSNKLGARNAVKTELRGELRKAAQPVQQRAQQLAVDKIRNIGGEWSRMRIGVTTSFVYVAEQHRGLKRSARKRPNLAVLLNQRALEPALQQTQDQVVRALEQGLDRITRD